MWEKAQENLQLMMLNRGYVFLRKKDDSIQFMPIPIIKKLLYGVLNLINSILMESRNLLI